MAGLPTLAELKDYIGPGISGSGSDAELKLCLSGATNFARAYTGRLFTLTSGTTEVHDGDGSCILFPRQAPIVSVQALTVDGEAIAERTTWDGDGFVVYPYHVALSGHRFGQGIQNVGLTYTHGYADVPDDVRLAVLALATFYFKERTRIGLLSTSNDGGSVSFQTLTIPITISQVLDAYRRLV